MVNIAVNAFGNFFQGTIRGYDELVEDELSVVGERRQYKDGYFGKKCWIYLDE